jgi:alkylation response protein AidB-like acyl-CoA dehydrogenase
VIQSGVGLAEGKLRSSRAFLVEMIGKTWDSACRGEAYPMEQRALLRIAITNAMNQAREVADWAYQAAGTNAIFEKGPFERRFRDMHTVAQQGQAHLSNFEFAGKALLGIDPGHRV